MSLSQCLRERVICNHTKQQLSNSFVKQWRDQDHFKQYLRDRCVVHNVLDAVIPEPSIDMGLVHRLHNDLQSLDIDYTHTTSSTNLYAEYLTTLLENRARPELVAHAYCFIGAHVSGGGTQIASSATGVLPPWFLDGSAYFNIPNRDQMRMEIVRLIDMEATYMSARDMMVCVQEVDVGYRFATLMLNM